LPDERRRPLGVEDDRRQLLPQGLERPRADVPEIDDLQVVLLEPGRVRDEAGSAAVLLDAVMAEIRASRPGVRGVLPVDAEEPPREDRAHPGGEVADGRVERAAADL